jgi:hypothetical protein
MNFARIAAAAVVAWLVSIPVGFVVNEYLLADVYLPNAAALRGDADMLGKLPLGFGFLLIGYFAFAYAYAKGYEGGNGVMEGIRFGVLVAIMVVCFGIVWQYILYPITGTMSVAMIIDSIVEMAIYGAIVGAIYKPLPAASRAAV